MTPYPKHVFSYLSMCLFFLGSCKGQPKTITWPNGAKAALCLTYDDGLSSHVNIVAPLLEKYNFKATFFPNQISTSVRKEMSKWKALSLQGHELGNHTVYHPCRKTNHDWVEDDYNLDTYSIRKITREIEVSNVFLQALDGQVSRTFAYTCGENFVENAMDFRKHITPLVTAARDAGGKALVSTSEIDLYHVTSWSPKNPSAADLINYVQSVIDKQTLSTITFHDVGGTLLNTSPKDHEDLLKFLDTNRDKIWVTTFKEATDYLRSMR